MKRWIQLDLFTGEPIPPNDKDIKKQYQITKQIRLALSIQLSIARLDPVTDTMKLVGELCQQITGITYPIDINERRRSKQKQRQQQTQRTIAAETQKPRTKRGRPKGSHKPIDDPFRKQIDNSF